MPCALHPLAAAALREVHELHAFFEQWLGASGPSNEAAFRRVEAALAPDFAMVATSGQRLSRAEVLGWLRSAHGSRCNLRISIEEPIVIDCEPPLVVMSYVEVQRGTERSARRSLAVLREAEGAPCGVLWIALQETWTALRTDLHTGASASEPA